MHVYHITYIKHMVQHLKAVWITMEIGQRQNLSKAVSPLCLFLIISIFLQNGAADSIIDPTSNQNLNPTQAWRSSEYCLWNISTTCQTGTNYTLTSSGWLNVTAADGPDFCSAGGCADHTRAVLHCIKHVKRDYWFRNGATVQDIYDTINNGCSNGSTGFTGISKYGSHHTK